MNTWSMNTWLLIIGGIGFAVVAFEIWNGKTYSNRSSEGYTASNISRKTEPVKFWLAITVQVAILAGLLLFFYFQG